MTRPDRVDRGLIRLSRLRRCSAVLLVATGLAVLPAGAAQAHPIGNITVNTADRLVVTADGLTVLHVVDLAEIPTLQLEQSSKGVDTDRDGELSPAELTAYAERECADVAPLLGLEVDGEAIALQLVAASGASRPGTGSLQTTRLECRYDTGVRPNREVRFSDGAAGDRNGWREVTAASECGPLTGSDVPVDSPSGLLASYPEALLQSPADVTSASFTVDGGASCTAGGVEAASPDQVAPRGLDRLGRLFTDFVNPERLSIGFAAVALVASVVFGAAHALAPGHGKTVMAAYLVGQRGTRRQALQLGAFVTFSHTASVLALGAALTLATFVRPELVVPATEVLSGLLLAAVGVYLLVPAVRRLRGSPDHGHAHGPGDGSHEHDAHDHEHERTRAGNGHPHSENEHPHSENDHPQPAHEHEHGRKDHDHPHTDDALEHPHAGDAHAHPHTDDAHEHAHTGDAHPHTGGAPEHDHAHPGAEHHPGHGGTHDHPNAPARELVTAGAPARPPVAADVLEHSHGGRAHTHAPLPEGRMSLRTLAAVGVAGGLVPSPSALLVLLGATALGRAWFGVLLVLAYGVGMAATLTAAGLLLLRARAAVDRRGWGEGRAARLVRLLPLLTAAVVLVLGLVLVLRGVGTGRPLL